MSTIPKTNVVQISFKAIIEGVWVSMPGAWEVCFKMQHHGWRRMKIYKKLFNPPIVYMHNDSRWHGM
jgi:hypothetical protein